MKTLSPTSQRWLKAFHILSAGLWTGGALTLNIRQFLISPSSGDELNGILSTMLFIDYCIIIPGATGTLITGILYSIFTNWGWFRHRWITVKWIICLYGVIAGTYPLHPWLEGMASTARGTGLAALTNPEYLHNRNMLYLFGTFQGFTIVCAVFISALKPWGRRKADFHAKTA